MRKNNLTSMMTVIDVVREPVLILDKNFRVVVANESFYRMFQVEPKDAEGKIVYELGSGQWNIPAFRQLLEVILPKNTFFKGFELTNEFPFVGRKTMMVNARRIDPYIMLAIEDVTDMMVVAEAIASHIKM